MSPGLGGGVHPRGAPAGGGVTAGEVVAPGAVPYGLGGVDAAPPSLDADPAELLLVGFSGCQPGEAHEESPLTFLTFP